MKTFTLVFALCLPLSLSAQAPEQCADAAQAARQRTESVAAKYKSVIAQKTTEYQSRAAQISDEAPEPEPLEAVLDVDITVEMKDEEFFIDLPVVTMKDQTMSMDLPQVTMQETRWSFDVPTIVMRRQCQPGIPETVCDTYTDDFGIEWPKDCYTRPGPEICFDVPVPGTERQDWIFQAPEITMGRTEWVMSVPEFRMETQRIVLGMPQVKVKNVRAGIQKTKDDAENLKNLAASESANLSNAMREEAAAAAAEGMGLVFECQGQQFAASRADTLAKFDSQLDLLQGLQTQARSKNAEQLANGFQTSIDQLQQSRRAAVEKFEALFGKLREAQATAMSKTIPTELPELSS